MNKELTRHYKEKSLSKDEYVLSYEDAIEFINEMVIQKIPIVAWEGWIKYRFGKIGHSETFQGTAACLQRNDEDIETYIKRANNFARSTIEAEWMRWYTEPEIKKGTLYFCITIDETIWCTICSMLPSQIKISNPSEYFSVISQMRDLMKDGKIELVSGNCDLENIAPSLPWPDDIINHIFN